MKWDYRFLSGIALSICMLVTYATESGNRDAYVSVVSESMLDYFEGLPRSVSRKLDKELADFITQHEDQFFSQKVVTVSRAKYDALHKVVASIVSTKQLREMESLITFNATVPPSVETTAIINATAVFPFNTTVEERAGNISTNASSTTNGVTQSSLPLCVDRFEDVSRSIGVPFTNLSRVKTVVEMEYVFSHPMIRVYARQGGVGRILENPNLLRELKSKKNKLLTVLFLDMSLISLLDTEIYCHDILSEESVSVRFGVAFGKKLDATQLSAIPAYFTHVSRFAKRALNSSNIVFRFPDENFTSRVIHVAGVRPSPCLFFDLLGSCHNGGACVCFTGIGTCRCQTGFKGKFCKTVVSEVDASSETDPSRWLNFVYMMACVVLVFSVTMVVKSKVKFCCAGADDTSRYRVSSVAASQRSRNVHVNANGSFSPIVDGAVARRKPTVKAHVAEANTSDISLSSVVINWASHSRSVDHPPRFRGNGVSTSLY